MDFSKLLQAILAQFQNVRINWVALLFDPEFHTAVAKLIAVIAKHTASEADEPRITFGSEMQRREKLAYDEAANARLASLRKRKK